MRLLLLALALALALPLPAAAGERGPNRFEDRPDIGQPLRFTDAEGMVYRPRVLEIVTAAGTVAAALPATSRFARSENRVDFSATPYIGRFFQQRLTPGDAARDGILVGPLYRRGGTLVLDARGGPTFAAVRDVALTAHYPRDGAVSHWLGRLDFAPAAPAPPSGTAAGAAYVVDGVLVLAGPGRRPLIEDWSRLGRGG